MPNMCHQYINLCITIFESGLIKESVVKSEGNIVQGH